MVRRYVDYTFYDKIYEGTLIPSESFTLYIQKASYEIGLYCLITEPVTEEVKFAACELAEINYKADNNMFISSESVGRMSKSYYQSQNAKQLKRETIRKYLFDSIKSRMI